MPIRSFLFLLISMSFLGLAGCSGDGEEADAEEISSESAEILYSKARNAFAEKDYKQAVEWFDEVERQHPYSEWAPRAQIMAGFTHYKAQDYDDAMLTLERFIKLHPGHESAPYAHYLIALSYYEQISDVGRDQGMTEQAMERLREVVKRFPASDYARDARLKLDLTEDHLAGKEMMVGRYYLERDEYLAALGRFRNVIDHFQTTSHTPEALHRLVESYLKLGVKEEAQRYAAVLGHNFPGSPWYQHSYALLEGKGLQPAQEDEGGWLGLF